MSYIDPYLILGVKETDNIKTIEAAYHKLVKIHHQDKGGSSEQFQIIRSAFKMIVDNLKKGVAISKPPSLHQEMKSADREINIESPQTFFEEKSATFDPNKNFNNDKFNELYRKKAKKPEINDYRSDRTKDQFLKEQSSIDSELEKLKPIMKKEEFDNTLFQKYYEHFNGKPDGNLQTFSEVQPASDMGYQNFTDINTGDIINTDLLNGPYNSYQSAYSSAFHPEITSDFNEIKKRLMEEPDITVTNQIDDATRSKMTKKMDDMKSANFKPENSIEEAQKYLKKMNISAPLTEKELLAEYKQKFGNRDGIYSPSSIPIQQLQQREGFGGGMRMPVQQQLPQINPAIDYTRNHQNQQFSLPIYQQLPIPQQNPSIIYQQPPVYQPIQQQQQQQFFQQPHQPQPIYQQFPMRPQFGTVPLQPRQPIQQQQQQHQQQQYNQNIQNPQQINQNDIKKLQDTIDKQRQTINALLGKNK